MKPNKMSLYISVAVLVISFTLTVFLGYRVIRSANTMDVFMFQYAFFAMVGTVFYITKIREVSTEDEYKFNGFLSQKSEKFAVVAFLIIFSLLLFLLNDSVYIKPLSYYLLVSLATVIIGIQIVGRRKLKNWIFVQIFLLALIIHGGTYLINPYLTGPDIYAHQVMASPILESGYIGQSGGTYYYYPLGHVYSAILGLITSFIKDSIAIAMLTLSLLMIPLIYLIGTELGGKRVGLMCMLLVTISTQLIFTSVTYSLMGGTFSIALLCIYALLKSTGFWSRKVCWIMFWIPAMAIFFFHPVTVTSLVFILGGNFMVSRIMNNYFSGFKNATPFASYFVSFVAYLMFVHYTLFQDITTTLFIPSDATPMPIVHAGESVFYSKAETTSDISRLFYIETSLAYLGYTFVALFGAIGSLKWLEYPHLKRTILIGSLALLYLFPLLAIFGKFIEPTRFLSFISILLTVPAGAGLLFLFNMKSDQMQKISIFAVVLALFSFFSVSSYTTNDNNEILNDKIVVPTGHLTQAVIGVRSFLEVLPNESLMYTDHRTDVYLGDPTRSLYAMPDKKLEWLKSAKLLENEGFFIINLPNFERGVWATEDEKYSFIEVVGKKSSVYDNGDVKVYYG